MNPFTRCGLRILPAGLAVVLATAPAGAQMIPVDDFRMVGVHAKFGDIEVGPTQIVPTAPFASFEWFLDRVAEYPPPSPPNPNGHTEATAYQNSLFLPAGIFASGTSQGGWQGDFTGTYWAYSLFWLHFRVDYCIEYSLNVTVKAGDPGSTGGEVILAPGILNAPVMPYQSLGTGTHTVTGRISPGTYSLQAASKAEDAMFMQGPTYSVIWTCGDCLVPLIAQHPAHAVLVPGNPLTLSVVPASTTGPATAQGTLAYQWRRNLVPLIGGPGIDGEDSPTLSLTNPSPADTGYYDVVVSDGEIVEPSSLAHVTLGGVTGVDPLPGSRPGGFSLEAAAPNPSASATSFRWAAERPLVLSGAIHDVAGRVVWRAEPRVVSGAGVLTWAGRDASGDPVAPGIYFLRVLVDGEAHVRRVVRLP
jgi:hypothetical protein